MCKKAKKLIDEIKMAETLITQNAKFYYARENECPAHFKLIMLINHWASPFIALNELLKRIDTNEGLLKKEIKKTGKKIAYKSCYKKVRATLQEAINCHAGKDPKI